jgi:hypothetical protein
MSKVKVNNITPFSGQNITLGGHAIPSGSDKNLGSATNAWSELYVSTGSVNFVAPVTLGQPTVVVATLRAGGEGNTAGVSTGQIFTETNNLRGSFSVGRNNRASGTASLANGQFNTASGLWSHAEGESTFAHTRAHSEGLYTIASGDSSHAEGVYTTATATGAHSEGYYTTASGVNSHAEGEGTLASGIRAHAEGNYTVASGTSAHAEGSGTIASGSYSHAEGWNTIALGAYSHAEGYNTRTPGQFSHAEGNQTLTSGDYSHAKGYFTTASGYASFAAGAGVVATASYQVAVGQYNALNNTSSIFIVGAGQNASQRKDGFSVESDGNRAHIVIPANQGLPTNPKQGSMFFNQDTNMLYIHNGTAWKSASFS